MDETKVRVIIPREIADNVFEAARDNFFKTGYLKGFNNGKTTGFAQGFLVGAGFAGAGVVAGAGLYFGGKYLLKALFDSMDAKEEVENKILKEGEETYGSESVQGE